MDSKLKQEWLDAMNQFQVGVVRLLNLYMEHPELNDLQPTKMQNIIPMSLDEWPCEIDDVIEEIKTL